MNKNMNECATYMNTWISINLFLMTKLINAGNNSKQINRWKKLNKTITKDKLMKVWKKKKDELITLWIHQ